MTGIRKWPALLLGAVLALPPAVSGDVLHDPRPTADCETAPFEPGLGKRILESGGVQREYALYAPLAPRPGERLPLVVDLHGSGSSPEQELAISGMAAAADRHGFMVALPYAARSFPAGGHTWNVPPDGRYPDDIRFLADLLDALSSDACIDGGRVFLTGFSGGARLASEAACALSERVSALAVVGGLRAPGACMRPVPVLAVHGTADPINPYAGGGPDYWTYGIDLAFRRWAERNGCVGEPGPERLGPDVQKLSLENCADRSELILYRIVGGGHVWPGSGVEFPRERFGPSPETLDATALILDFFVRHGLAGSHREVAIAGE